MPAIALLHILVAVFFAVHAVKTGRDRYWLMVLFAFPLLGSLVYFFAEYSRDLAGSRGGRRALRLMQGIIDPERALRAARDEFDRTPTAYNEAQLARALLAHGDTEGAMRHYRHCIAGPYAKDASFLKGLAIAELEAGQHAAAIATLEWLFAAHPDQRAGDLLLMHAEALGGAGRMEAEAAFDEAARSVGTVEALCKRAQFLLARGRRDEARAGFEAVLAEARRGHRHSREMNRRWIDEATQALETLQAA